MAVVLNINNDLGRTDVDLMDATKAHVLRGNQIQVGDNPDGFIIETFTMGFASAYSDDNRATWFRDFKQLMAAGKSHYDLFLVDKAVWLDFKPESATNTQYAKIRNGGVQSLGTNIIGGHEGAKFTIWIEREVAWRDKPPDGTAGTTIHSAESIYNKNDGDGNNWKDFAGANNDLPGLLEIHVNDGSATWDEMVLAKKVGSTTDLDKFNPWFNAVDEDGGGTQAADTAAPADVRILLNADETLEWNFTAANVEFFTGNYLLYTYCWRNSGSGTATMKYIIDHDGTDVFTSDAIALPTSESRTYLGRISLPGVQWNNFLTYAAVSKFKLEFDLTGTADFYYYTSWLVPVDFPPYTCTSADGVGTSRFVIADGVLGLTYIISSGAPRQDHILTPNPPYPTTAEDENTRLFMWLASGETMSFNDTITWTSKHVKRFAAVQGGV